MPGSGACPAGAASRARCCRSGPARFARRRFRRLASRVYLDLRDEGVLVGQRRDRPFDASPGCSFGHVERGYVEHFLVGQRRLLAVGGADSMLATVAFAPAAAAPSRMSGAGTRESVRLLHESRDLEEGFAKCAPDAS